MKKLIYILILISALGCSSDHFTAANGEDYDVSTLIGMDVFDVAYNYSRKSPETLEGTNNKKWVVYYSDINVTMVTDKQTNIVQKATSGRNPQ
tara:strand:+ start:190 stop:468 length:279 start_codon:yes stop_codon:yes gene_type:complete